MSLFGYPATVMHHQTSLDDWGVATGYSSIHKKARVIEQQKLIKNGKGEEVQSIAEIHLEGNHRLTLQDYFEYVNEWGETVRFDILHIEPRKFIGTDRVKKVIIYA